MKMVDREIYEKAVELARIIFLSCPSIDLIFLDQWRRPREENKWRLTYLGQVIGNCSNQCQNCQVFKVSGGEDSDIDSALITTLVKASDKDKINYDGKQNYLNCKSLDQYINSFVSCFLSECYDRETMLDELDYVIGFKVVYSCDGVDLKILEMKIKQRIIRECLFRYSEEKKQIFAAAVLEIGLPKYFVR